MMPPYETERTPDDRYVRIYERGEEERLPAVSTFQVRFPDPTEDARLEAEYGENNRRVGCSRRRASA
jgi:hypothetical protein